MYRESVSPPFYFRLIGFLLLAIFIGIGLWFILGLSREVDGFVLLFSFIPGFALLAVALVFLLARISTVVDAAGLRLRFAPLYSVRIARDEITEVAPTDLTIWSYGGIGLRGIPGGGFAFLFQGGPAVRITTTAQKTYIVRSNDQASAIESIDTVRAGGHRHDGP